VLAAPTISPIVDITILQHAAEQTVAMTGISDGDDGTQPLRITATSSSPGVIPHPSVAYDSPGSSGTLQFTPVAGISGPVQITVNVEDGGPDGNLQTPADNESITTTFGIGVQAAVTGFGVAGDSLSDEFLHESYSYAKNWVEILESQRGLSFGARNDTTVGNSDDRGEPRREGGFEFNWARSGATSGSLLDEEQHTGLASQITTGDVSHVVLSIGQNDFSPGLGTPYFQIYNNLWSANRIEQHVDEVLQNITAAVKTIDSNSVKLVLSNIVDYSIAPATQDFFTNASKRQRVTNVIDTLNQRLREAADDWLIPLVDMNSLTTDLLAGAPLSFGGNTFTQSGGASVTNLFVADGAHPHTVSSSILANGFLAGFHYGYQDWVAPVTEQEVIDFIGLPYTQDTLNVDYQSYVILPVNDSPELDLIDGVAILEDAGQQLIELAGIRAGGGESQPLKVTATSSNTDLIPNPTVTYTSADATGSLKFTPVADQHGVATITVAVEDGGLDGDLSTTADNATVSKTFGVEVKPWLKAPGNVDKDTDFDASDAILMLIHKFNATDTQIENSKGTSLLTADQVRHRIDQIDTSGDVDGDGDFDSSDALLCLIVEFKGTDTQINNTKGLSLLSAAEIKANVAALGQEPVTASSNSQQASVFAAGRMQEDDNERDGSVQDNPVIVAPEAVDAEQHASVPLWSDVRGWLDAI